MLQSCHVLSGLLRVELSFYVGIEALPVREIERTLGGGVVPVGYCDSSRSCGLWLCELMILLLLLTSE